ncbi:MAG: MmgE/PrpD family protein [Acidobacteriia bacterium]|nr:MmgE/PrpD family protein [Terriglobia bacterium]
MVRHVACNKTKDSERENALPLTRRSVLQRAGWILAAATFPPLAARPLFGVPPAAGAQTRADYPISDVMTRLSTYMCQARDHALPDDVVERAKLHILDTFGAMVSGSELPAGRAAIRFARAYGGKEVATIVADTVLCGPIEAALANAVMAHADESDDHMMGVGYHPGNSSVSAALAVGEQFSTSGMHFLRAVVLGYDIGARVLHTVQPGLDVHKSSFSLGGVFGATAAAACSASLTDQQMRWALSYAAQQCSGLSGTYPRDLDHIEKGFDFAGMPARSGVTAALLVHEGWNGVNDIMSGPDNFLLANYPAANPALLIDQLGEHYAMMDAGIKRWTSGGPSQEPLYAMEAMLKRQPIDPNKIQEVILRAVRGHDNNTDNGGWPDLNIQYLLALMLIDKKATFRSIHDKARMQDPAIVALRQKVRLEPGFPGRRDPLIQITLTDGTRLVQDDVPTYVQNPLTREQVIAKARDLMEPVIGDTSTSRLIDRVLELEKIKNIHELRPLLQWTNPAGPPRLSEYPYAK